MNNTLTCPKCGGAMTTYERNGVHIDQCGQCRGIFLDRGELERLIDAEARHYQTPPPGYPAPQPYGGYPAQPYPGQPYPTEGYPPQAYDYEMDHDSDHHKRRKHGHHGDRRRRGFFDDLFD
jgi:uncharacterized protein